ncbi:MAG: tetratricopeptide repeat protein [Saprospiraceae bacterium]|nr:tetratricopeptide repeat protein [Saprospiraceae bacterium]
MDVQQALQALKDRIRKSETEEALEELAGLLESLDTDLTDEAYALQQQLNLCLQQSRLNLIDYKEYSILFSNISFSTLRLITVASKQVQLRQNTAVPSSGISVTDSATAQPAAAVVPGETPDMLQSGMAKIQNGDYAGAMADLTTFLEKNPTSWAAKFQLAILHETLGMWEEAIHWYTETVLLNPKHAIALNNRGTIRMDQLADFERAYKDFNAALVADPKLLTARFNKGLASMHQGQYPEAIQDLDVCVAEQFQLETAAGLRGVCRVNTMDLEGSMSDLKIALKADPENASYWGSYGICQYHLGNYRDAIEFLDRSLELDPKQAEVQTVRGIAYYFLEEYDPAEQDFRASVQISPAYAYAWFFLGLTYKMRGNYPEAVEYLNEAVRQNAQLAEAHAILGVIAYEQNQYNEAIQFCEAALRCDPNQETAKEFLEKARGAKNSGGLWNKLFGG